MKVIFWSMTVLCGLFLFTASAIHQVDWSEIVAKVSPATVTIYTDKNLGSGFIISDDGKVATNFHVIKDVIGNKKLLIRRYDGSFLLVTKVLKIDKEYDLAILQAEGKNLPYLPLGDSDTIKVGEPICVIGAPLGLEATVSEGIISAIRELKGLQFFQITAPVSPGNSGSPVINRKGEVIGIVVFQFIKGQNLNFAIPVNILKKLMIETSKPISSQVPIKQNFPQETFENLPKKEIHIHFRITKNSNILFIPSIAFIDKENVEVIDEVSRKKFVYTNKDLPKSGEYTIKEHNLIIFSKEDEGKTIFIRCYGILKRIVIIPTIHIGGPEHVPKDAYQTLIRKFQEYGFEVIPEELVKMSIMSLGINIESIESKNFYPEIIQTISQKLNAHEIVISWARGGSETGLLTARAFVNLLIYVFDGFSGNLVYSKDFEDRKDATFTSFTEQRQKLISRFIDEFFKTRYGLKNYKISTNE
jgi:hypothetical protein